MYEVIPGILEKDWSEIERKIELVAPFAKTIHVDLLDGIFAPNISFADPKPFTKYTKDLFFELHLMVDDPIIYLKPWADAGFRRFIGHVEKMPDQVAFVAKAQSFGEVGLAVDAQTPVDKINVSFADLDCLLAMTVQAGFSGQKFLPDKLEKVKALRSKITIPIEVDGGINEQTVTSAKEAGATWFIATSFLFKREDPKTQFTLLKNRMSFSALRSESSGSKT